MCVSLCLDQLLHWRCSFVTSISKYNLEIPRLLWLEIYSVIQGDTVIVVNILALWCYDIYNFNVERCESLSHGVKQHLDIKIAALSEDVLQPLFCVML